MAHCKLAGEGLEAGIVKDLGHQPHVLIEVNLIVVKGGNARRLLPPVLQGIETKVGQGRHFPVRGMNAKHPAGFFGLVGAGRSLNSGGRLGGRSRSHYGTGSR
jgi:hypothetical protein